LIGDRGSGTLVIVKRKNWLEFILIVLVVGILGALVTNFAQSLRQSNAIIIDRHGIRKQTCIASSLDPNSKACFDTPSKKKANWK
jgi:hypothetical protein